MMNKIKVTVWDTFERTSYEHIANKIAIEYNGIEYHVTLKDDTLIISADNTLAVFPAASNMIRVKVDDSAPGHKTSIPGDIQFVNAPTGDDK